MKVFWTRGFAGFFFFASLMVLVFAGCQTGGGGGATPTRAAVGTNNVAGPDASLEALRVGDLVKIDFSGVPGQTIPAHEEHIKEDGTISLEYIGSIQAAGKTTGQLQREIRQAYVPKYYREGLAISVRGADRFYYVGGEVKSANRQVYWGPITVTGAIKSAGDFTDFANKKKVKLIRANGTIQIVNCTKALEDPRLDPYVYPGDNLFVPKRIF